MPPLSSLIEPINTHFASLNNPDFAAEVFCNARTPFSKGIKHPARELLPDLGKTLPGFSWSDITRKNVSDVLGEFSMEHERRLRALSANDTDLSRNKRSRHALQAIQGELFEGGSNYLRFIQNSPSGQIGKYVELVVGQMIGAVHVDTVSLEEGCRPDLRLPFADKVIQLECKAGRLSDCKRAARIGGRVDAVSKTQFLLKVPQLATLINNPDTWYVFADYSLKDGEEMTVHEYFKIHGEMVGDFPAKVQTEDWYRERIILKDIQFIPATLLAYMATMGIDEALPLSWYKPEKCYRQGEAPVFERIKAHHIRMIQNILWAYGVGKESYSFEAYPGRETKITAYGLRISNDTEIPALAVEH